MMEALAYEALELDDELDDDEEPPMQVHGDDGCWHRRAIGQRTTACGEPICLGDQLRHETYDGRLCTRCFTKFELAAGGRLTHGG